MKQTQRIWWQSKAPALHRFYTHSQIEGLLRVREYLITDIGGRRCLLLRWVREMDADIDGMTYAVVQLDAAGRELNRRIITHERADIPTPRGGIFAPERGIPADSRCADVRVYLLEVRSGEYIYRISPAATSKEEVTVTYATEDAWVYDRQAVAREKLSENHPLAVRSLLGRRVRGLWPIVPFVLLALALLLASGILLPAGGVWLS